MVGVIKFFAGIWLRRIRYPWSRLYRWINRWEVEPVKLPGVGSVEDVSRCLRAVQYKPDDYRSMWDAIEDPRQVWKRKAGDCDGSSVLAAALTKALFPGTRPVLLTVVSRNFARSHTVCVYEKEGHLWEISNWHRAAPKGPYRNKEEIATSVAWRTRAPIVCWDVVDPETLEQLEFHS